jgi:hypothetical protein
VRLSTVGTANARDFVHRVSAAEMALVIDFSAPSSRFDNGEFEDALASGERGLAALLPAAKVPVRTFDILIHHLTPEDEGNVFVADAIRHETAAAEAPRMVAEAVAFLRAAGRDRPVVIAVTVLAVSTLRHTNVWFGADNLDLFRSTAPSRSP